MSCGCSMKTPDGEIRGKLGQAPCKCDGECKCTKGETDSKPCRCPPAHPSGATRVVSPDTRKSELFRRLPPMAVPPLSLIRCEPPHEELRPAGSFIDCDIFAALHWGGSRGGGKLAEPPQALDVQTRHVVSTQVRSRVIGG